MLEPEISTQQWTDNVLKVHNWAIWNPDFLLYSEMNFWSDRARFRKNPSNGFQLWLLCRCAKICDKVAWFRCVMAKTEHKPHTTTASELWEFEIVMLQFHHSPTSLSHQFIWLIVYYFDYLWFITSVFFCIPTIHTSNPYMWSYRGLAAKQENRNVHAKTWTSFVCDCFFCFVCLFVCGKKAIYTQNGSSLFFLVANCEI